jgi:NADH:ubiquinone oxidoreductase subunit B-like Fe-S oxidoreductase
MAERERTPIWVPEIPGQPTLPPELRQQKLEIVLTRFEWVKEIANRVLDRTPGVGKLKDLAFRWARKSSLWYMTFGLACCAIEMMATAGPRYDFDRFGMIPRATPRQADLMIVAGTVTYKWHRELGCFTSKWLSQSMSLRWAFAPPTADHSTTLISVINGIDKVIPVDVYVLVARRRQSNCFGASSCCRRKS